MPTNKDILQAMISTMLHLTYETEKATDLKDITDKAGDLRIALNNLYPVNPNEWHCILIEMCDYIDLLL